MADAAHRLLLRVAYWLARGWWFVRRPDAHGAFVAIWHDGHLLLVRNSYRRGESVPCGGIRRRETPRAAARRELREEVGVDVDEEELEPAGDYAVDFEHKRDHAHFFEWHPGRRPALAIDRREVVWAGFEPAEGLLGRALLPHVRAYVEAALPRVAGRRPAPCDGTSRRRPKGPG